MDYLLVSGGVLLYLAGGFTIFFLFRTKIIPNSNSTKRYKVPQDFYKVLDANTDFSVYENTTEAIEFERRRIGNDIHDELAPYLGALYIDLELVTDESNNGSPEATKLIIGMRSKISKSIAILKNIIFATVPPALVNKNLEEAISELCQKHDNTRGSHVLFKSEGPPFLLSDQEQLYLYRIIQELLNNSIKHSLAWYVYVFFKWSGDELKVIVSDNGIGLPKMVKNVSNYGMTGIFVRAKIIGAMAKFNIPTVGMEFELILPRKGHS